MDHDGFLDKEIYEAMCGLIQFLNSNNEIKAPIVQSDMDKQTWFFVLFILDDSEDPILFNNDPISSIYMGESLVFESMFDN